jgi:hypothetical protein
MRIARLLSKALGLALLAGAALCASACAPGATPAPAPTPARTWSAPAPTLTVAPTPSPTLPPPTRTPVPTLMPTAAPLADGWREVRSGVWLREMWKDAAAKNGQLFVVRIDPAQVDFHVRYQPDEPLRVAEWYSNTSAFIVVNSSFFDQARRAVGVLTADGVSAGQPHARMEGAFYLTAVGATVWPLQGWVRPAGLQVLEAVESFPMLLLPGGLPNPELTTDARVARRTVAAVDRAGRVLFIGTAQSTFTLYGLAVWLANSDLDIDTALNFDGGSSAGLLAWTPQGAWGFDSANRVPAVITVDTKVLGTLGPDGGEWP